MTPADLADLLRGTAAKVFAERGLDPAILSGEVDVQRPRKPEHGDYVTHLAMRVAKKAGTHPSELAAWLAAALPAVEGITAADVAGPGFLNIRLAAREQGVVLQQVCAEGSGYGTAETLRGTRVDLAVVSAELTEPLHLGSARCAAVGAALGRIVAAQGAGVAVGYGTHTGGREQCVHLFGADDHAGIGGPETRPINADDESDPVQVLTVQPVGLLRDIGAMPLGERAAPTVHELVEAVGVDAARYSLVRSSNNSDIDIDVNLWATQGSANPVYFVQYAHARAAATVGNATGFEFDSVTPDFALLTDAEEGTLVRTIGEFPRITAQAATRREPHRIARYLEELAGAYHLVHFDKRLRVLPFGDELVTPINAARLALADATRQVLANGLALLGVTAPERM